MRFIRGPLPEDAAFQPEEEGWKAIREPGPVAMQFIAIPVIIVVGFLLLQVITLATPIEWRDIAPRILPAFLLMIPVHELIHALVQPSFGMTPRTYIGVWPSHLLFYAYYDGELSRGRFAAILIAPTVVLTIIPLLLCVTLQWNSPALAALAVANGIGAAGDLIGVFIVLTRIPAGVLVRNKGWRSYWRRAEAAPLH